MLSRLRIAILALCALALCLDGCKKQGKASVSGKVSYQGKKIVYGSVVITGDDDIPHNGAIQSDGTYSVDHVPFGSVRVAVNSPDPAKNKMPDRKIPAELKDKIKMPPEHKLPEVKGWFPIPAMYGDFKTSGLTTTVDKESTTFDIDLK
jgi:hypothetical protein